MGGATPPSCIDPSGCVDANFTGDNPAPDLTQQTGLTIGQSFEHPCYCNYQGQGGQNCGNNGEFQNGGDSATGCKCRSLCTNDPSGCRRKLCKRLSYSGTQANCCNKGGVDYYMDGSTVRTCDPVYRKNNWSNLKCNTSLKDFCSQGNNLFTDTCRAWVTTFSTQGKTGNGDVDTAILAVCNRPENATREECACVVAANEVKQKLPSATGLAVQCIYNKCVNNPSAFRTATMLGPCNVVNCEMNINDMNIVAHDPANFSVSLVQSCGQSAAANPPQTPPATTPTSPSNPTTPTSPTTPTTTTTSTTTTVTTFVQNYWIWIMIIIIIMVMIMYFIL